MITLLIALIGIFSLQRCLFAATSLLRSRPAAPPPDALPQVAVVLVSRDEGRTLEGCLAALGSLDYPPARLSFVLVSDGSRDETAGTMAQFAQAHRGTTVLAIQKSVGKAAALNQAVAAAGDAAFLAVYDTDLRPSPDSLRLLVEACAVDSVGAASGIRVPTNRKAGVVAAYASLESDVHQWVTLRGRHLLGWNPPTTGGNCVYRREALLAVGGFRAGALSEDTEASLALVEAGWRTVLVEDAVSATPMADSWRQFTRQRLRWTSGLYASARVARGWQGWLTAVGYFDRVLFLAALAASAAGLLPPAWLLFYLLPPLATVLAASARSGHIAHLPRALAAAAVVFPWDICLSAWGTLAKLAGWTPTWQPVRRRSVD